MPGTGLAPNASLRLGAGRSNWPATAQPLVWSGTAGIVFIPASAAGDLAGLPVIEVAGEGTAAKRTDVEGTDAADAASGGG
jgi:hypothetical protein